MSGLSTTSAQNPGRGRQAGPPYRPEAGAKDLRAVLFNWTWYMGMLRGLDEHELVATLEYQGKGTIQVDGQPCALTKYRVSNNYQTPGERIEHIQGLNLFAGLDLMNRLQQEAVRADRKALECRR